MSTSSGQFALMTEPFSQEETMLYGLPYQSLIRLVSPNDPYGLGSGGGYGRRTEADVATLYSAASVRSIPLHVARHTHGPPLAAVVGTSTTRSGYRQSSGNTLSPPILDGPEQNWTPSPRVEYDTRDLAVMAIPLELRPDDIIEGEHGIVRSIILNDRMHALTVSTIGCVAVWDIARYYFICIILCENSLNFVILDVSALARMTDRMFYQPWDLMVRTRVRNPALIIIAREKFWRLFEKG